LAADFWFLDADPALPLHKPTSPGRRTDLLLLLRAYAAVTPRTWQTASPLTRNLATSASRCPGSPHGSPPAPLRGSSPAASAEVDGATVAALGGHGPEEPRHLVLPDGAEGQHAALVEELQHAHLAELAPTVVVRGEEDALPAAAIVVHENGSNHGS
jgi:hypothetical protein